MAVECNCFDQIKSYCTLAVVDVWLNLRSYVRGVKPPLADFFQHFWWSRVTPHVVLTQFLDYVVENVVWHDNLPNRNFSCAIEVVSVEEVVGDFESTTFLEQFLNRPAFKVKVVKRRFTVADDVSHLWMSGSLSWATNTEDSPGGLIWFITGWWHELFAAKGMK